MAAIPLLLTQSRWVQTAIAGGDTIANTAAATIFASTLPVHAGAINVLGRGIHVKARGLYGTDAVLGRGITVDLMAGATVLASSGLQVLTLAAAVNDGWVLDADIWTRTIGAGGNVEVQGKMELDHGTLGEDVLWLTNAAVVNLDLTAAQTIGIRVTWNVAAAANTIQQRILYGELMGNA